MRVIIGKGQLMGPISGADETLVTYATQLQAAGTAVSILLMYPPAPPDPYYLRLCQAGVPITTLASPQIGASLSAGRVFGRALLQLFPRARQRVRRKAQQVATGMADRYCEQCCAYLRQSRADLLHVLSPDPSAMVMIRAAHLVGLPVFYQELGTPYQPPGFEAYYQRFTSVLPLCAEVAALSPRLAEMCRAQLTDVDYLSIMPVMTDDISQQVATSKPKPKSAGVTFGFAARLEPLKGPLTLIESFVATRQVCPEVKLSMAGNGSQKQQLAVRAARHNVADRCEFLSVYTTPAQKSAFMQNLDVFVLPSQTEGTPNSIIEAMGHGLPVIATHVGGVPDIVTQATGILVPPDDVAALSQAMSHLAANPDLRAKMGRAARARYKQLFAPAVVLPLILNTYRRIVVGQDKQKRVEAANGNDLVHPWAHNKY